MPSERLSGKRVLLTGTAGGQGAAAQRLFAADLPAIPLFASPDELVGMVAVTIESWAGKMSRCRSI